MCIMKSQHLCSFTVTANFSKLRNGIQSEDKKITYHFHSDTGNQFQPQTFQTAWSGMRKLSAPSFPGVLLGNVPRFD